MRSSQELSRVVLQSLKEAADMGLEHDDKGMTPQELCRRLSNSKASEALTSSVLLEFLKSCPQLVMPSPYQPGAYILCTVFESLRNTQEESEGLRKRKRASSPEVTSSAKVIKASLQDPASSSCSPRPVREGRSRSAVLQNLPPSAASGKPVSVQLKSETAEVADAAHEEELAQLSDRRDADVCVNSPRRPAGNHSGAMGAAETGSGSSSVWRKAFLEEQEVSRERLLKVVELQAQLNEVQKLARDRQAALLELQALVEELKGKLKDRDSQIKELQRSEFEANNLQCKEFGQPFPGLPERARSSSGGAKDIPPSKKPSSGGLRFESSSAGPVTVAANGGVSAKLSEAWQALASFKPSKSNEQISAQKEPVVKVGETVFRTGCQEGEQKPAGGADHVLPSGQVEPGSQLKEADEPEKKRGRGRPKGSGKVKKQPVVEEDFAAILQGERPVVEEDFAAVLEGEVKVHHILVEEERVSKPAAHPARKPSCKCCGNLPECRVELQRRRGSLQRKTAAPPLKAGMKGSAHMKWDDLLVKKLRKKGCKGRQQVDIRSRDDVLVRWPRKKGCKRRKKVDMRSRKVVNTSWLELSTESSDGMETVNKVGRSGQEGNASALEAGQKSQPPALVAETLLRKDYMDDSCAVVCVFRMVSFVLQQNGKAKEVEAKYE